MWLFIAGATTADSAAASAQLVSRLSASPAASLAIVFAEAGAIRKTSAFATSSRWLSGSCSGRLLVGERAARGVALELAREHRRAGQRRERRLADEPLAASASARPAPRARPPSPGARTRAPCRRRCRR
jgi:hypothetical protein